MNLEQSMILHLDNLNRIITERTRTLVNKGGPLIHAEQVPVLMALYHTGPLSQQELANKLYRNKSSIQRTVVRLLQHNLVRIGEDCWDRRKNIVSLTEKAKQLAAQLSRSMKELEQKLFDHISREDRQRAIALIREL